MPLKALAAGAVGAENRFLHCLHCRSSEGTSVMTSGSGGEHPADTFSFQGLPDAHVTVKYLTPKSDWI
jgi:hypothetical protein